MQSKRISSLICHVRLLALCGIQDDDLQINTTSAHSVCFPFGKDCWCITMQYLCSCLLKIKLEISMTFSIHLWTSSIVNHVSQEQLVFQCGGTSRVKKKAHWQWTTECLFLHYLIIKYRQPPTYSGSMSWLFDFVVVWKQDTFSKKHTYNFEFGSFLGLGTHRMVLSRDAEQWCGRSSQWATWSWG